MCHVDILCFTFEVLDKNVTKRNFNTNNNIIEFMPTTPHSLPLVMIAFFLSLVIKHLQVRDPYCQLFQQSYSRV